MSDNSEKLNGVMNALKELSTGMIADALLISGINGGVMGVRPARGFEDAKIVGPAVTVLFSPPRPGEKTFTNYEVIRQADPGSVLVIDGKGFDGHFTGDNQAACARKQGLEAIVVFGGARDLAGFRQVELPLYCKGSATRDKPAEYKITGPALLCRKNCACVRHGIQTGPVAQHIAEAVRTEAHELRTRPDRILQKQVSGDRWPRAPDPRRVHRLLDDN